jgi:hypothetical protein
MSRMVRRACVVVAVVAGVAVLPAQARAQSECSCQVFAQNISWKSYNRWEDRTLGNHMFGEAVKARIKRFAKGGEDTLKVCREKAKDNPFLQKVCKAAKACVAAGGATLYAELQAGTDAWTAERHALVACEAAIFAVMVGAA